jgi:hypothetical protein
MTRSVKSSLEFRPMQGLMNLGSILARRFGLSKYWDGEEGLSGVVQQKLSDMGVPEKPIPLNVPQGMTARQLAEHAGFIKKRKRIKR